MPSEPESRPWKHAKRLQLGWCVLDDHGSVVAPHDLSEKQAEHIVDCVNQHDELIAQRDALAAALTQCTVSMEIAKGWFGAAGVFATDIQHAEAALAKVASSNTTTKPDGKEK